MCQLGLNNILLSKNPLTLKHLTVQCAIQNTGKIAVKNQYRTFFHINRLNFLTKLYIYIYIYIYRPYTHYCSKVWDQ